MNSNVGIARTCEPQQQPEIDCEINDLHTARDRYRGRVDQLVSLLTLPVPGSPTCNEKMPSPEPTIARLIRIERIAIDEQTDRLEELFIILQHQIGDAKVV